MFKTILHEPEKGRLLYVGSLIGRKGLDLLIDSLPYIESDYSLRIVGNGTKEQINELMKKINEYNLKDKIEFCGYKEGKELINEYSKAELFVFPTKEDCFGLVLLEALYAKLPIITSKYADGAYDIVVNKENGIIADPFNSQELGKSIDDVLSDKIKLNGENIDIENKFTFENVSKGYIEAITYVG